MVPASSVRAYARLKRRACKKTTTTINQWGQKVCLAVAFLRFAFWSSHLLLFLFSFSSSRTMVLASHGAQRPRQRATAAKARGGRGPRETRATRPPGDKSHGGRGQGKRSPRRTSLRQTWQQVRRAVRSAATANEEGWHPFLFVASFLDPQQVKGLLRGNNENVPYIMLPNQYEDLKRDVIDHMIALVYENKDSEEQDNGNEGTN